jgi:hypothetical protein
MHVVVKQLGRMFVPELNSTYEGSTVDDLFWPSGVKKGKRRLPISQIGAVSERDSGVG